MLNYHYCLDFEYTTFNEIKPNPKFAEHNYNNAYGWLENEIGFYPIRFSRKYK